MNITLKEGRLVLLTRANSDILAFLPSLEGRRVWLKGGGLSIEDTPHNRHAVSNRFNVIFERNLPEKNESTKRFEFSFVREPDTHQHEALAAIGDNETFGLFMEQGTGKTKVSVDWANKLYSEGVIGAVLVVSKMGVHRQWIEVEVQKDTSGEVIGDFWKKKHISERILKPSSDGLVWFAINYDGVKTKLGKAEALKFCKAHKGRLLIISDESQEIKNYRSQRHMALTDLKVFSSHRILLTGTPIAKDLTDEWAQLKWLNESILRCKYITTFKAKYCIMGGFEGKVVVGQKNMDEFRSLVDPYTFRRTKEQIGMLPKRYTEWDFDLTKEQRKIMRQIKDDLIAELNNGQIINITHQMTVFTKLQQASNGFLLDEGKVHRLMPVADNPRANAMIEWINSGDGKAIVWSCFIPDKVIIREALEANGISYCEYHSGIKESDRPNEIAKFLDPNGPQILIAGESASTGLNLQGLCNRALYYSNSFKAIIRWQSEDRIHRIGTIGAVIYTDLIAIASIDRYILRNLRRKEGISRLAIDEIISVLGEII